MDPNLAIYFQKKHRYYRDYSDEVADQSNVKSKLIPHNFHQPNGSIRKLCICTVLAHKLAIW